jgi:hypothetical protein
LKTVELILIRVTGGEGERARVSQEDGQRRFWDPDIFIPAGISSSGDSRGKNPDIHLRFSAAD